MRRTRSCSRLAREPRCELRGPILWNCDREPPRSCRRVSSSSLRNRNWRICWRSLSQRSGGRDKLEEARLVSFVRLEPQLFVTQFRSDTPLRGALEITLHDEVRLIHFFKRIRLLAYRNRHRADSHGSAAKFYYQGFKDALVHFI